MRNTRQGTVDKYRDEYLAGRDQDFINKFNNNTPEKQYIAIMNWKRYQKVVANKNSNEPKASVVAFFKYLKNANAEIQNLSTLSPKEAEKALELIDSINNNIVNFDKIRKQRILEDLLKQDEQLQKESDSLKQRIADLRKELE